MVASRSAQLRPNVLLLEFDVSSVLKIACAIENNRIYHVKSVCQREGGGGGGGGDAGIATTCQGKMRFFFLSLSLSIFVTMPFSLRNLSP